MRTSRLFAAIVLSMLIAELMYAQHDHGRSSQVKRASDKQCQMMGTPTFERSVDGLQLQVWVISQVEHRSMMDSLAKDSSEQDKEGHGMAEGGMCGMAMKGMKHDDTGQLKHKMGTMMSGTHHVMVAVADESTMKAAALEEVNIEVISPSGNLKKVGLTAMMNHFGGSLILDEKGSHTLRVIFDDKKETGKVEFSYSFAGAATKKR